MRTSAFPLSTHAHLRFLFRCQGSPLLLILLLHLRQRIEIGPPGSAHRLCSATLQRLPPWSRAWLPTRVGRREVHGVREGWESARIAVTEQQAIQTCCFTRLVASRSALTSFSALRASASSTDMVSLRCWLASCSVGVRPRCKCAPCPDAGDVRADTHYDAWPLVVGSRVIRYSFRYSIG